MKLPWLLPTIAITVIIISIFLCIPKIGPIDSLDGDVMDIQPRYFVVKNSMGNSCAIRYFGYYPMYVSQWVYIEFEPDSRNKDGNCRGKLVTFKEVPKTP